MNIKEKLQIYLITYNRLERLKRTFNQIFDEISPIKNFDITILDNASTDGTSEFIEEYCKSFPNIKHIRHKVNIGGNANICRAFELGASCGKEYVWVLCDDDYYDWSGWDYVEKYIEEKKDIICVSNYFFQKNELNSKAYLIPQLTFVPAGIYKAELITDNVLSNMNENTFTMFQQSCITIQAINENKKIKILNKQIVDNGLNRDKYVKEEQSYSRGITEESFLTERTSCRNWILGFCNITTLLKDKKLRMETIEKSILHKGIYGSYIKFVFYITYEYLSFKKFNFFYEIYKSFPFIKQLIVIAFSMFFKLIFVVFNFKKENKIIKIWGITFKLKDEK